MTEIRYLACASVAARLVTGLMMVAVVACSGSTVAATPRRGVGCDAPPAGQRASSLVPGALARRLPGGVLYILAGPDPESTNLWQVTNSGCQRQLTHYRRGYGVSDFGASPAGVILSDASTGVDQLARLGPRGPVLLPDGFVSTVGIDPAGRVVFIRPPTGSGRKNVFQVVVKRSYRSAQHVIYQQKASLSVCEWGPKRHIVTIGAANADGAGPTRLLDIGPKGGVHEIPTGLANLGNAHWGTKVPGIAVVAGSLGELIRPDGVTERLPHGWHPAAWNPAGTELLVWATGDRALGLWKPTRPHQVLSIGRLPTKTFFAKIVWLAKPAKT